MGENSALSDYELQRLERIRKNEAFLESLGLKQNKAKLMEMTKKTKRNQQRARTQPRVKPGEERRSSRGKRDPKSLVMLSYDKGDFNDTLLTAVSQDEYFSGTVASTPSKPSERRSVTPSPSPRGPNRLSLNREDFALTAKEKEVLSRNTMDDIYLQKFEEFLLYHNKISDQNRRNVMRQVTKLALGQGIHYDSAAYGWKPDQFFRKGQPVTPLSDFVELMEEARDCEDRWGRDHGNGWLLSHPLKKMLLFQQFCLQNPDFLSSTCKLNEYYAQDESLEVETICNEKQASDDAPVEETKKRGSGESFAGLRVAKDFDGAIYNGHVHSCNESENLWCIVYDDGDEEEMNESELQEARELFESSTLGAAIAPRKRGRPCKKSRPA